MIRAVAAIFICLALAGIWWHGFKRGERADKTRSDLVIAGMVNDAQSRLVSANEQVRLASAALQARTDNATRTLQAERATNQRRLDDARATAGLVRQQLADFASGEQSGDDTLAACRSDAGTIGNVLGVVLSDLSVCTAGAEKEAAGARSLLDGWPVTP